VKHRATPKFWKFHEQLPKEIQKLANANYELLNTDPRHPSLPGQRGDSFGWHRRRAGKLG
jgi:hypothetical protein